MIYSEQTASLLVTLTLAGNHDAYEELVKRYRKAVLSSAMTVTRNSYMAEDASQDAFVTAWMKLDTLKDHEKFGAWVCKIAKNCAKSMVSRFKEYIYFDTLETESLDHKVYPEDIVISNEENKLLKDGMKRLPKKVRTVLHLHYFEGLSIAEIAERMTISTGTVKWHLHDGRQKLRKDLSAMNERENDTLVEKVMKKVKELEEWKFKTSKNGFEDIYRDVLCEVEALPESVVKHSALANVWKMGCWWIPGEENDELIAKIKESALIGRNEDVMEFVMFTECGKVSGGEKNTIEFILNTQIPFLKKHSFNSCLATLMCRVAYGYAEIREYEKSRDILKRIITTQKPSSRSYAEALTIMKCMDTLPKKLCNYPTDHCRAFSGTAVLQKIKGEWRLSENPIGRVAVETYTGFHNHDCSANSIFLNAGQACDKFLYVKDLKVGDIYTASDETTKMLYESDCAVAETLCGTFDDCHVFAVYSTEEESSDAISKTFYKEGIGIVRQELIYPIGYTTVRVLKEYDIKGGTGLFPCHTGNRWEYSSFDKPEYKEVCSLYEMTYADDEKAYISTIEYATQKGFDETSWLDTAIALKENYFSGWDENEKIVDISYLFPILEKLAKTKKEKVHTKVACDVMKRIIETDETSNPLRTHSGHWNFFQIFKSTTMPNGIKFFDIGESMMGALRFEWKKTNAIGSSGAPLLFNMVYDIFQDATGYMWNEAWCDGFTSSIQRTLFCDINITTDIIIKTVGMVSVLGGEFDDCLEISLDIKGLDGGYKYRGGKKVYTFAKGVGLIKTVHHYSDNTLTAVYELSSFKGTGDGYFPASDGMFRRYDAVGLTEGFIAYTEYSYVGNNDGTCNVYVNQCGVKKL